MAPKQPKNRESTQANSSLPSGISCSLPVWDDAQIQQDNWGTVLSAVSTATSTAAAATLRDAGKATAKGGAKEGPTTGCYVDQEGRALIADVLASSEHHTDTAGEPDTSATPRFTWQRPADVMRPFRPVVHRNTTPFVDPYATEAARTTTRRQETSAEVKVAPAGAAAAAKPAGRKSEAHKEAEAEVPHYEAYPETVTLLHDLVGQGKVNWETMSRQEAIQSYRAIAPLMQPYNPTLVASCAETPAEAVGSRYSTALRHKLKAAEALSALDEIPPFFMSGFNSVLLLVHQAQYLVPQGAYLWELVYPHAPGTCHPVYNPYGKYAVKLFVDGAYRKVVVDDALPVDGLGRPLLTVTSRKELWPAIIAKAIVKVCGHAAGGVLLRSPEVMVPMLLGNWVPSYVTDRKDSAETAAACLRFANQLTAPPATPLTSHADATNRGSLQRELSGRRSKASLSRTPSTGSGLGDSPAGKAGNKNSSRGSSSSGRPPTAPGVADGAARSPADTALEASVQKQGLTTDPVLLCGLRETPRASEAAHPGSGNGTQLYSVASVVPFRHTLALAVRTTPKTDLEEGLFARERDRPDVHELIHTFELQHDKAGGTVNAEDDWTLWLTLEEFCASMDALLLWHAVRGQYAHQLSVDCGSVVAAGEAHSAAPPANAAAGKKHQAAGADAKSQVTGGNGVSSTHAVHWVKFTCTVPSEVLLVASRCLSPLASREDPQASGSGERRASHSQAMSATATTAPSGAVGTAHTMELSYYVWDRCDPLTTVMQAPYYTGKVCAVLLNLSPGMHLYRLRLPAAGPSDCVAFFSNAEMELLGEDPELGRSSAFFILTDADKRGAVDKVDNEYLWFKRKFKVSEPTRLTLLLQTLQPSDDVTRHRLLPSATGKPTGKAGGSKTSAPGGGGGAAGSTTTRRGSVNAAAGAQLLPQGSSQEQLSSMPILRFTRLMLVNLDNRQELVLGEGGRLPQLLLQPNTKGYYLTAFTRVSSEDVEQLQTLTDCRVDPTSHVALYAPGQWKLIARSDHEVQHFESLPLASTTVSSTGSLARGGSPLLFRYTCVVPESTHITVAADVHTNVPGCQLELRITHVGRPATPSTATTSAALHGSGRPDTGDSAVSRDGEECVFESGWHGSHFFLPEFLLEPLDKSKPATFAIEGRVPAEFASAWDEQCRLAQEQRFLVMRQEAEQAARARQEEERQLALSDPAAFALRKQEEQASQQQQQQLQEHIERTSKETRTRKKRSSIQAGTVPPSANGVVSQTRLNDGSFSAEADAMTQQLDAVDDALSVHYHVLLDLSSAKAECKQSLPPSTGLSALRQQWSSTIQSMKALATPTEVLAAPGLPSPPPSSRGIASATRGSATRGGHQKDSITSSPEDIAAQRVQAAAQRPRQQFLKNPDNLFFPRLQETTERESTPGKKERFAISGARGNASTDAHGAYPVGNIIVEDTEENNFRHTACLTPTAYTVRLLPLWASEVCEPVTPTDGTAADKAPSTGSGKRAKSNKDGRLSGGLAGSNSNAVLSGGASSGTTPVNTGMSCSSPSHNRQKEEQELAYTSVRQPLVKSTASLVDAYKESRESQQKNRKMIKEMVYAFWDDQAACAPDTVARPSADVASATSSRFVDTAAHVGDGGTASVVRYTSLLGRTKEEGDISGVNRRQRSVNAL